MLSYIFGFFYLAGVAVGSNYDWKMVLRLGLIYYVVVTIFNLILR